MAEDNPLSATAAAVQITAVDCLAAADDPWHHLPPDDPRHELNRIERVMASLEHFRLGLSYRRLCLIRQSNDEIVRPPSYRRTKSDRLVREALDAKIEAARIAAEAQP